MIFKPQDSLKPVSSGIPTRTLLGSLQQSPRPIACGEEDFCPSTRTRPPFDFGPQDSALWTLLERRPLLMHTTLTTGLCVLVCGEKD